MRILVDGMPRTKGGIGSLILNMAEFSKNYCQNEIEFEFIIAGRTGYLSFLDQKGYRYFIAPPVSKIKQYKQFLVDLFSNNHYDYLWFNNTSKVNIILPLFAKKYGVKVISHPHGVDIEEKGIKRLIFKLLNIINRKRMFSIIDVPFACSEEAADVYYKGNAELRNNVEIIHNGVDVHKYSFNSFSREKIRKELGIMDEEILLGAVGRLSAVKNYPLIINALEYLDSKYKMIILGEGEDKYVLESLIHEKRIADRCFLLGSKDNVADYLSALDCFLMPSFNEGMPYSIIEAQCSGLPCIVSNTLSDEMNITGLVHYVPIDDVNRWVNAINNCIQMSDRLIYANKIIDAGYGIEGSYFILKNSLT